MRRPGVWLTLAAVAVLLGISIIAWGWVRSWEGKGPTDPPRPGERNQPERGSPAEKLPWAGNPEVEALLKQYRTPVLMAAYKTTLPDPILDERYNIALAADRLAGTVVGPGEVFSQNRRLGPYTKARGFRDGPMYAGDRIVPVEGGGVCKIASTLYNVVVLSNLEVVERHPHRMTVPYVPPGQDATVSDGTSLDFRFRNNTGGPIVIWADTRDESLYMAIYGRRQPPRVTWHHQTLGRRKAPIEYRTNASLPRGSEKVVAPGQEGVTVRSWLTIEMPDGTSQRQDLGIDRYIPSPRIIERGRG